MFHTNADVPHKCITPQPPTGLFQATGWPSVVSVVANWFGKGKRGLIMGIWNAHTSVGNILGTLLAAAALPYGWGWSFILPGALIGVLGIVIFLFLIVEPGDIGFKGELSAEKVDDEEAVPIMDTEMMRISSQQNLGGGDGDKHVRQRVAASDASPSSTDDSVCFWVCMFFGCVLRWVCWGGCNSGV